MYFFTITTILVLSRFVLRHLSYFSSLLKNAFGSGSKALAEKAPPNFECPYDYILNIYGHHHFQRIVNYFKPKLQKKDPQLNNLILEVLDAVHFGAILVDDVADNSTLRKGQIAAHRIYGSSETINRAYLVIFRAILKCQRERPEVVPFLLDCITEIHQGQDDSLVWRRDGFDFPKDIDSALDKYRHCASLKTGALFRLVGQLITCSHEKDEVMSEYGWYCQLQNDCKNVFSSDVKAAKGALAEDLTNGEYSFPIIVGLYSSEPIRTAIAKVFNCRREHKKISNSALNRAIQALQSEEVRSVCLEELEDLKRRNSKFAALWGRQEKMSLT
jgi:geranylgeranyldiphosphate transferase